MNLTEHDFKLLIDGLEALPDKDLASNLMRAIMASVLTHNDKEVDKVMEKFKLKDNSPEKELLKEDIKILQGKLLMLKRYLMENGALNETQNIVDHIS